MDATPLRKNIDEYLARVPEPARGTLNKIRAAIRSVAPPGPLRPSAYGIACVQAQRSAGVVRRVFEALQFVPGFVLIEAFQGELKSYATSKGRSNPHGQATANCARQKSCQRPNRGE